MLQFRKKPVVIEAMLFADKASGAEIWDWANGAVELAGHRTEDGGIIPIIEIKTLEGLMLATIGDWIIKGIKGEFYPCKPDIFAATYDPVGEADKAGG